MPTRNLIVIVMTALVSVACYSKASKNRYADTITEAMRIISTQYVDEVDNRQLFSDAMTGMAEGLDQYSSYLGPERFKEMEETLDQEFGGVGIIVEVDQESKRLTVMSPLVGTPAYEAGMRAGDTIMEINGESTEGMTLNDSVKRMKGPIGSPVDLIVRHANEEDSVSMTLHRAVISVESVLGDTRKADDSWNYRLEANPRIGYIRLTTFGKNSVQEVSDALAAEEGRIDSLILDLRGNAGGLLKSAVQICEMFIEPGKRIVSTKGRGGHLVRAYESSTEPLISRSIPMVVLTNRSSASASEIVAACLQDHDRATIVGERTWGKGTVQNIIELEGGRSALKLTTASYWRPSEKNIHRRKDAKDEDDWGVRPNEGFEVPLTPEDLDKVMLQRRDRDIVRSGEPMEPPAEPFDDPQLRRAINHLKKPASR